MTRFYLLCAISFFASSCTEITADMRSKPLTLVEIKEGIKEGRYIANRWLPIDGKRSDEVVEKNALRWLQENGHCLVVWYSSGYFSSGLCLEPFSPKSDLKTTVTAFLESKHSPNAFGKIIHYTHADYAEENGNPQTKEIWPSEWHNKNAERPINAGDVIMIESIL